MGDGQRVNIGGPYFEDLEPGQVFDAPAMTLTWGHAAIHQAIAGDTLRMPLDATLSRAVTGRDNALIHPNLVCDLAIGQSTTPTQRVVGNLFYRGLVLLTQVFRGDTLRTRTEIVGLKQNRPRAGGGATGLVAMRMRTENQHGEAVLDFFRCPMIPLRDPRAETGHRDDFARISQELDMERVRAAVPDEWEYERLREHVGESEDAAAEPGTVYAVEGRETVTSAPELARLTLNLAMTHRDAGAGARGRRLVYGGQTISIAAAHATRALPRLATIVAWRRCDHSAPVFEGDILSSQVAVVDNAPLERADATLVELRVTVHADRGAGGEPEQVLDWSFLGALA